jgi:putative oxidoreductase
MTLDRSRNEGAFAVRSTLELKNHHNGLLLNGGSRVLFPELTRLTDLALLLLRFMVALVFGTSGWNHLKSPEERSKSIGMSKGFTMFLGTAEVLASLGLAFGVLTQLAALGLILIMLGAIQKKIFVWHIGFWVANGWNYDLMLVVMNFLILVTGGGRYALFR